MPFVVHHSHRAESLVERLADVLRAPTANPFAPDAVVVHGKGLERWLEMQLAGRLGICANVRFPFPGELIGAVAAAALGEDADLSAWSGDRLTWAVRASLRELADEPALEPLRVYVEAGGPEDEPRRAQGLSQRVAAIFERLAVYRPELVREWRAGGGEGWEPPLWRAAAERVAGDDVATVLSRLEAELDRGEAECALPGRIALFSVTTLPPLYVRAFAALGRRREVHFFQLHPSPAWWGRVAGAMGGRASAGSLGGGAVVGGDESALPAGEGFPRPEHPLLASMGRTATDMQRALLSTPEVEARGDDAAIEVDTLLRAVQADIHEDVIRRRKFDPADRSIQVHACHGPTRQVEVLREVLLDLFETHADLQPRDVVVMAPDIETYAPLVGAVFADGEPWERRHEHPGRLPRIPFRVADRGVRSQNPVAEALLALLSLAGGRLPASSMLDLLAMEPVRARFGVDADDLPQVREWVAGCGVRWARDAAHRAAEDQPALEEYTWRFGLSRLLIGQAMHGADERVLGSVPFGEVEGQSGRALLGRVVDFAESVFEALDALEDDRTVAEWSAQLSETLDAVLSAEPAETWRLLQVHAGLARMADAAREARFDEAVDLASIVTALEGRFAAREPGAGYLSGSVTFCQLVPMRNIPFEVVCLLGMDDGEFPRVTARPGFDRMAAERQVGDRTPRDDDRALFLEALMSARRCLVVMTTGRGVKDDRPRPPAVPVSELLDVVDATFGDHAGGPASTHLTKDHPLLPFSARAFDGTHGFDARMRDAAVAARRGLRDPEPLPAFLPTALAQSSGPIEIDLHRFSRFWQHPMRHLCQRQLGIWLDEDDDPVEDREPLEIDALEQWSLRDRLLRWALAGEPVDPTSEAYARARGEARLPLGTPGRVIYEGAAREAAAIAEEVLELRAAASNPSHAVEVDFAAHGVRLTGAVSDVYGLLRAPAQASRVKPKTEVTAWVEHLALAASGVEATTHLVGHRGEVRLSPLDASEAREELARLLELYREGLSVPLLFFPATSKAFHEGLAQGDVWDANKRARGVWDKDHDEPGPYGRLVLGDAYPFYPDAQVRVPTPYSVAELAEVVWAPALRCMEVGS